MRRTARIFATPAVFLAAAILSSCAPHSGSYYYRTLQQSPTASEEIKAAGEFKVRPLDFSFIRSEDLRYPAGKWKKDLETLPESFAEGFEPKFPLERKMNKKVVMLTKDEPVTSGIVVDVAVQGLLPSMRRVAEGRYEQGCDIVCRIIFTDAASGKQLFSGLVRISSKP